MSGLTFDFQVSRVPSRSVAPVFSELKRGSGAKWTESQICFTSFFFIFTFGSFDLLIAFSRSTEGGRKFGWSSTTKCRDPNALIAGISCCSGCKNKTTGYMNRKGYTCENAATKWPEMYTEHCALFGPLLPFP